MSRRHVFKVIPIESVTSLAIEAILLLRLFFIYTIQFRWHPILTTMVASSLMNSVSDTVAQTITIVRERLQNLEREKDIKLNAIHEEFDLPIQAGLEMMKGAERPFDYERLARMTIFGFFSSILQFKWFTWLEDTFPIAGHSAAMKRLLADQLFYAPAILLLFFALMNLLEGNSINDLKKRLSLQYVGALKAQYIIWPFVQFVNFKFVPLMYQLPLGETS